MRRGVCEFEVGEEVCRELVEVVQECVVEEKVVRNAVCSGVMRDVCEHVVTQLVQQECR